MKEDNQSNDQGSKDRNGGGGGAPFVAGLLTGALLGAAVAMLLAPQTGEEARDLLRAKSREATNRARDAAGDLSDRAKSTAADVSAGATDMYSRGRKVIDEARSSVSSAIDEGKDVAQSERDRLRPQ